MDYKAIEQLIKAMNETDLTHLEIEEEGLKIKIKKEKEVVAVSAIEPRKELNYDDIIDGTYKKILSRKYSNGYCVCILMPDIRDKEAFDKAEFICNEEMKKEEDDYCVVRNEYSLCLLIPNKNVNYFLYTEIKNKIEEQLKIKIYIGIGDVWYEMIQIKDKIFLALEQIHTLAFYEKESNIYNLKDKLHYIERPNFSFFEIRNNLLKYLETFDEDKIIQEITQFIKLLYEQEFIRINVLRRMFMDLLSIYSTKAQKLEGTIEEISIGGENRHYQSIMNLRTLEDTKKWFLEFSREFIKVFYIRFKCASSEILHRTLMYIDNHIYSNIQLSDAAKEIGVSEVYLSSYFKKEMGEKFTSYINKRKIQEAKKLLASGKLVYEVSDILGFENNTYFSKVFKKYTNETPNDYRKKHIN